MTSKYVCPLCYTAVPAELQLGSYNTIKVSRNNLQTKRSVVNILEQNWPLVKVLNMFNI